MKASPALPLIDKSRRAHLREARRFTPRNVTFLCAAGLVLGLAFVATAAEPAMRLLAVRPSEALPPSSGPGYEVAQVATPAGIEHRLYLHSHHFLSIVDSGGTFNIRAHPGVDQNGWGSSLYLQPFIAGATLGHAVIGDITPDAAGVSVVASGAVSRGASATWGTWTATLSFTYDPATKRVAATGTYSISLAGPISGAGGDLNLYRLASNCLDGVPLLDGSTGATGDMTQALITGHNFSLTWNPAQQPGYFPQNPTYSLSVETTGAWNQVDTAAQGLCPIQAAYKPTVKVGLTTGDQTVPMVFGGIYATDRSKDFSADNVGITPVITAASPTTEFNFAVSLEATPLGGDGTGIEADLSATFPGAGASIAVTYKSDLTFSIWRLVGSLPATTGDSYAGTVVVPFPPTGGPFTERGFFVGRTPCTPP
jgi:hypothetical protein